MQQLSIILSFQSDLIFLCPSANIPNGKVAEGEVLAEYLPPFPPKGVGYQRVVFVLYKQQSRLDLSSHKVDAKDYSNLEKRTFSTLDFYRQHQDELTPAGLAFYQTNWDESLTEFYHNVLRKFASSAHPTSK